MTAIALCPKRGGLLAPLAPSEGVGPEADAVQKEVSQAQKHLSESVALRAVVDPTLAALNEVAGAAATSNWDGYGGRPVDARAYANASRFLILLPTMTPVPEIAVDPDGEIAITWQAAGRQVFSVSVGAEGRLSYAGLFGSSKAHGTEWLRAEIPQAVLDGIARVFAGPVSG